jgi:hypothetical protein
MFLISKGSTLHPHIPHTLRHARHRVAVAAAALLAIAGLALAQATPSHAAGTYIHQSCVDGGDLADAYGGWQPYMYSIAGNGNMNQCPWGGLHSEMYPGSAIPIGADVGWTYSAPPSTNITRLTGTYAGWTKPYDNSNQGLIQFLNGANQVGLTYNDNGADAGHQRTIDWTGLNTNSVTVRILCDGPNGNPGCQSSTGWSSFYYPKLALSDDLPPVAGSASGNLTTDSTLKGTKTLSYSATDQGGGVARIRLYIDGGLSSIDHAIDTNGGHCQIIRSESGVWVFSWPKPCPGSVNADEAIDTTAIADGPHTITAKVVDAGQREATVYTATKMVANHPPINTQIPAYAGGAQAAALVPIVGTAIAASDDGTWSGPNLNMTRNWVQCDANGTLTSCAAIPGATALSYMPTAADVGHRLRLLVTAINPADSVSVYSDPTGIVTAPSSAENTTTKPTDGSNGAGGANGADGSSTTTTLVAPALPVEPVNPTVAHTFRGHIVGEASSAVCPQDRATLKFEHIKAGQLKLGNGKSSTAQVQLTCSATGKAIAGAQLDIATKVGSAAAVAADVSTDGAGHAVLRLAKGASRAVTVGYRMYADDPIARATATLKVLVNSKLSLKANHKRVRNGQAVTLRGTLAGGAIPKRGVSLAVQWKDGKRWRPFAQIKTDRNGAFKYAYRFTRTTKTVTYALRVQIVKGQLDYPYVATVSKTTKVSVAP